MSKPTPDSDIIQPSATRASSIGSPVARASSAAVAGGGDRRRAIALRPRHVAAQQRQLGPVVGVDLLGDQRRRPARTHVAASS